MSRLSNMGLASNERREQHIMKLRRAFNEQQVATVQAAMHLTGYSYTTIVKWCKDGNIPLMDGKKGQPVVPATKDNMPKWIG